jgi:3-oxoacyl-[acyl-carrier protein] reductase
LARFRRRESHRDFSNDQEHSARHETAEDRHHHHNVVRGRPQASPSSTDTYSAAKAGIQILTQVVAAQAGPCGIRVNCIAPEIILTERNHQHIPEAQQNALSDQHPLRRLGTPEDVARAALFLASENAEWITGIILDVAGGNVML